MDPLTQVITLLAPQTIFTKCINGAGAWSVSYSPFGQPSFCIVLKGECQLMVDGQTSRFLQEGDFVLLPLTPGFTLSSVEATDPIYINSQVAAENYTDEVFHGRNDVDPDVRLLGGYFSFGSPDANLLLSWLPPIVHVNENERLATFAKLLSEESKQCLPGRELILKHLVELLLIESIRILPEKNAPAGLIKGLADERIATAIRLMHQSPDRPWTMSELARKSALSRTAFFQRFSLKIGQSPMEYLMSWRMAIAKQLLLNDYVSLAEIAKQVGYASTSAFSTAFTRHVGTSPRLYAHKYSQSHQR